MISDLDVWRAANLLIRKHGADAEIEAARLQDLMLARGDDEGRWTEWVRPTQTAVGNDTGEPLRVRVCQVKRGRRCNSDSDAISALKYGDWKIVKETGNRHHPFVRAPREHITPNARRQPERCGAPLGRAAHIQAPYEAGDRNS